MTIENLNMPVHYIETKSIQYYIYENNFNYFIWSFMELDNKEYMNIRNILYSENGYF